MNREQAPAGLCVWDVESSGVDIENDRIITCYAMVTNIRGEVMEEAEWVIDPGVEIPQGASDVHGMSTEWVREHGRKDVADAIQEIAQFLCDASDAGYPIVGYNNGYDLGILDRELNRHFREGLETAGLKLFFDPLVYDRANDKYRRGKRKLVDVARHYGIPVDESKLHDAKYDVELTSKLAWRILQKSRWDLQELQQLQHDWKCEWAEHLTDYFASVNQTEEDGSPIVVDGSFPYRRRTT